MCLNVHPFPQYFVGIESLLHYPQPLPSSCPSVSICTCACVCLLRLCRYTDARMRHATRAADFLLPHPGWSSGVPRPPITSVVRNEPPRPTSILLPNRLTPPQTTKQGCMTMCAPGVSEYLEFIVHSVRSPPEAQRFAFVTARRCAPRPLVVVGAPQRRARPSPAPRTGTGPARCGPARHRDGPKRCVAQRGGRLSSAEE